MDDINTYKRRLGMYVPMSQQEKDAWDEREEMLVRGCFRRENRRDSLPWLNLLIKRELCE